MLANLTERERKAWQTPNGCSPFDRSAIHHFCSYFTVKQDIWPGVWPERNKVQLFPPKMGSQHTETKMQPSEATTGLPFLSQMFHFLSFIFEKLSLSYSFPFISQEKPHSVIAPDS